MKTPGPRWATKSTPRIQLPPPEVNKHNAVELGYTKFWGYPCNKKHPGLYYVRNGACVYCTKERLTAKFYPRPGPDYDRQIEAGLEALYGPTRAPKQP